MSSCYRTSKNWFLGRKKPEPFSSSTLWRMRNPLRKLKKFLPSCRLKPQSISLLINSIYSTEDRYFDWGSDYLSLKYLTHNFTVKVAREDGQNLADRYACPFNECSAAETSKDGAHNVKIAFQKLIRQLVSHAYALPCPRLRFSSFSKMLTSFVSKTRNSSTTGKLERGLSSGSTGSKRSAMTSRSNSSDSNSPSTSESSLSVHESHQPSPVRNSGKCSSLPIPILFRKDSYTKSQAASIWLCFYIVFV